MQFNNNNLEKFFGQTIWYYNKFYNKLPEQVYVEKNKSSYGRYPYIYEVSKTGKKGKRIANCWGHSKYNSFFITKQECIDSFIEHCVTQADKYNSLILKANQL